MYHHALLMCTVICTVMCTVMGAYRQDPHDLSKAVIAALERPALRRMLQIDCFQARNVIG